MIIDKTAFIRISDEKIKGWIVKIHITMRQWNIPISCHSSTWSMSLFTQLLLMLDWRFRQFHQCDWPHCNFSFVVCFAQFFPGVCLPHGFAPLLQHDCCFAQVSLLFDQLYLLCPFSCQVIRFKLGRNEFIMKMRFKSVFFFLILPRRHSFLNRKFFCLHFFLTVTQYLFFCHQMMIQMLVLMRLILVLSHGQRLFLLGECY